MSKDCTQTPKLGDENEYGIRTEILASAPGSIGRFYNAYYICDLHGGGRQTFLVHVSDDGASFGLEVSQPQWRGVGDLPADRAASVMYDEIWRVVAPIAENSPSLAQCENVILWQGVRKTAAPSDLPADEMNIAWRGGHFEVEGGAKVDDVARTFLDALCAQANADDRARQWAMTLARPSETNPSP